MMMDDHQFCDEVSKIQECRGVVYRIGDHVEARILGKLLRGKIVSFGIKNDAITVQFGDHYWAYLFEVWK